MCTNNLLFFIPELDFIWVYCDVFAHPNIDEHLDHSQFWAFTNKVICNFTNKVTLQITLQIKLFVK